MTVLDASALLAFLLGEAGSDVVETALLDEAVCSAANWSETAQKVLGGGGDWAQARALLLSYEPAIAPVTLEDAEAAARLWKRGEELSLGDRLCLALRDRLETDVLTADSTWEGRTGVRLIR